MTSFGTHPNSPENRRAGILTNALLIAAVCVLPLIRDPWALDSSKVPRLLALNILLAGFFAMMVSRAWRHCLDWSAARHRVLLAFAAYTISVWASLFQAGNVSAGLIDACLASATLLLLWVGIVCFRSFDRWRESVAKAGIFTAIGAGLVGEYQIINLGYQNLLSRNAMESITGLMGNVNFYAGFLMLLLPICILGVRILTGWWRVAGLVFLIHTAFLVIVLQTRSAWLGSVVSLLVIAGLLLMHPVAFGCGARVRSWILVTFGAGALGLVAFFIFAPSENAFALRARSVFSKNLDVSDGGRMMIWEATLRMGMDHFPLGVGAGNFPIKLHSSTASEAVDFSKIDREWLEPHNDFLWIFAEKGVFGLFAFLLTFYWAFFSGIRRIKNANNPFAAWTHCIAISALAAYLVDSFFSFPLARVDHQVMLAILFAMIVADVGESSAAVAAPIRSIKRGIFATASLMVVLIIAAGLAVSVISLRQEWHVAEAREAMESRDWPTMRDHAQMAATPFRTLDVFAVPISFIEGFAWMKMGRNDKAIELFRKARIENPDKYYILNNLGNLLSDEGHYDQATDLFAQAINLYPERTEAIHNFALSLLDQERFEEAADILLGLPEEKREGSIKSTLVDAIRERNKARLYIPMPSEEGVIQRGNAFDTLSW